MGYFGLISRVCEVGLTCGFYFSNRDYHIISLSCCSAEMLGADRQIEPRLFRGGGGGGGKMTTIF